MSIPLYTTEGEKMVTEDGQKYGYPDCCIESFIEDTRDNNRIFRRGERQFFGTGFIPCANCSTNRTHQELIDVINTNRDETIPKFEEADDYMSAEASSALWKSYGDKISILSAMDLSPKSEVVYNGL